MKEQTGGTIRPLTVVALVIVEEFSCTVDLALQGSF